MSRTLDRTKDIFLDTMLLGNEILIKKIKSTGKTKVTIVLAAFRNVKRLKDIISDLYNQYFQEFEIIIVDDSSTQEIEEFVMRNDSKKINYIKKQLGSNAAAKNCGIEFAKGEYIIFLEENVTLNPQYLESLYNLSSKDSLDIAMLTPYEHSCTSGEKVITGVEYLTKEIELYKEDLNCNLTSLMFKKKFLDVYNLQFPEDMLALENLYFKIKTLDLATKVCQSERICYREKKEEKSIRNQAMIDASSRRIRLAVKKIETFKVGKSYEKTLDLLCGYLLLDVLRMYSNMNEQEELIEEIKSKKHYFSTDSFINKMLVNISPVLLANQLNRKERG